MSVSDRTGVHNNNIDRREVPAAPPRVMTKTHAYTYSQVVSRAALTSVGPGKMTEVATFRAAFSFRREMKDPDRSSIPSAQAFVRRTAPVDSLSAGSSSAAFVFQHAHEAARVCDVTRRSRWWTALLTADSRPTVLIFISRLRH